MENHYDDQYFLWQRKMGGFEAEVGLYKLIKFVKPDDRAIDFGCGGYSLKSLNCSDRIGIEINDNVRRFAQKNGTHVVKSAKREKIFIFKKTVLVSQWPIWMGMVINKRTSISHKNNVKNKIGNRLFKFRNKTKIFLLK